MYYPIGPSSRTKGPKTYTAGSDGAKTHVLGFKRPAIGTQSGGAEKAVPLKVLNPLLKPSFAVSDLLENHEVMFNLEEHGGSYLKERSTGIRTKVYLQNGVFMIPVWFRKEPTAVGLKTQLKEAK